MLSSEMSSDSLGSLPTGIVALMRRMAENGNMLPRSLCNAQAMPCINALHDIYGMVQSEDAGWRLTLAPQWLQLPPLPVQAEVVDEVPSTQEMICHRPDSSSSPAPPTPPTPFALFAEHQTAGSGQHGRGWLGLPGDAIAVSLRLPAPLQPGGLSVALGAMLCAALSDALRFKWPNDIVTEQRHKVAGILTQVRGGELIIGIGVNWRMTSVLQRQIEKMGQGGTIAAGLAGLPSAPGSRHQCAAAVVQAVMDTVSAYQEGFAPFRPLAEAKHILAAGEPIQREGQREGAPARYLGFADNGELLCRAERAHVAGG